MINANDICSYDKYAPVIIPTLNRYDHLKQCIDSLRDNPEASKTCLYIGVDYPTKDSHWDGYNKVIDYVENIKGFNKVIVLKHDKNLGAYENALYLIDYVSKNHDRYIISEDDNIFSKDFLHYANYYLDKYENDDSILGISGYFWPVENDYADGNLLIDTICSEWGFASWISKIRKFDEKISFEVFQNIIENKKILKGLRKKNPFIFAEFIKNYVGYSGVMIVDGKLHRIDLSYSVLMYASDMAMVYPAKSKVRNIGNDSSGENCVNLSADGKHRITNRNFNYELQEISENNSYITNDCRRDKKLEKAMRRFLIVKRKEIIKADIVWFLLRILGREKVIKLINRG